MKKLILLFFFVYQYCLNQNAQLTIFYKDLPIKEFALNLTNVEFYPKTNDLDIIVGKLCYEQNYTFFLKNCKKKYEGYNSLWILLIDNSDFLIDIIKRLNENQEKSVYAIIYNSDYIDSFYTNLQEYIPILSSNNLTMNEIVKYDINREGISYFIQISYSIKFIADIITFVFYFNLASSILFLLICAIWIKLDKYYRNQPVQIHKSFSIFPYIRVFTSILFCYYIYILLSIKENSNKMISQYILIVYLTLQSVYRTFFWFILLLLAYGWILYRESISSENVRRFVLYYIFIYLAIFFDPFLDTAYSLNILHVIYHLIKFKLSDIKNLVIYSIFTLLVVYESLKTYTKLYEKYIYSREFLQNYSRAIYLKMFILKNLIVLTVLYCFLNYLIIFSVRMLIPLSSEDIVLNSSIKFLDDLSLYYLLYLFRPREYPPFFDISLEEGNLINIFKGYLPATETLPNDKDFNKNLVKEKDLIFDEKIMIIVNPILLDEDQIRKMNIIDKISIGSENEIL